MKSKKTIYTMVLAATAFLAYGTFNIVKAETAVTEDSQINIQANTPAPAVDTTNSAVKELKVETQAEAPAAETKTDVVTEVKTEIPAAETKASPEENAFETKTVETPVVDKNTTVTEEKEVSPFDKSVTVKKTTTTVNVTPINVEDIQPAILKELVPETKEVITETKTIKEKVQEDGTVVEIQEKTTDNIKVEPTGVTGTTTEEVKVQEIKKELPNLDDISLPEIAPKTFNNDPVKIEVASQRIPVGTVIPVKLESSVNSISSSMGDQFNATLTSDIMLGDNIILPAGSVIRGTVGKIRKANILVREAKVMLIFDHIVTPAGKQIPVYAYLTGNAKINYEGYITGGTSYGKAFKENARKGKDIMINSTTFGVDKGLAYLAGVPVVITAPVCALGGALGGGGYIVGKSVYNIFAKGAEVMLDQGTRLTITLSKPLDIPLN